MNVEIQWEGLDELERWANALSNALTARMEGLIAQGAESLAAAVKSATPVGRVNGGRSRESIYVRTERNGDELTSQVVSDYPVMYFLEFGTGPVATAAGYPGEAQVPHVAEGWVYWSDEVYNQRLGDLYDQAGTYTVTPTEVNGFVYTEGMKPHAMFYNAAKAYEPELEREITRAMKEVIR